MSDFEGVLKHEDLGPGAWVLETGKGERLTLMGDIPAGLANKRVRVRGQVVEGMGIAMVGDRMVEVSAIEAA